MRKIAVIAIIIIMIIACIVYYNSNKLLVVGTNPTFPPFGYIGGQNASEVLGFDIELAKLISKNSGKELQIEIMDFQELIPALQSGKIDMAISVISITEERKNIIDFSESYYTVPQIIMIRADDESFDEIFTKEELGKNKKLGSLIGTTGVTSALEIAGDNPVLEFNSWPSAFSELLNKKVDALVVDGSIAKSFLSRYEGQLRIIPIEIASEDYAVAVKKGNTKLLNSINTTINKIKSSGQYDKLVENYIDNYNTQN